MFAPKLAARHDFFFTLLCSVVAALVFSASASSFASPLVSNVEASQLGLVRSWFAQVRVDPSEHKVAHWVLDHDQIFAITSAGTVQSIDSETGETLWITEVGRGHSPAAGIAVNKKYVAILGASRLYLLDRVNGHQLWSRQVGGASSAAPALSKTYAYVALMNGRVEGYRLDDPTAAVWQHQSFGRVFQSPTTTGKVVSWPTDRGLLYVGKADSPGILFRVETNDEIVAAAAEQAPYLYVASLDGYLYCFHELTGSEQWRYATGFAITSKPAVVGDKAFVASEGPSLHAVDATTGQPLWQVAGATQFAALGKQHTYCMDRYGQLIVLDNESGSIVGRIASDAANTALVNEQSDRIFLVNDRGLVQCLHEIGADQPLKHRTAEEEPADDADTEAEESDRPDVREKEPIEDTFESPQEADDVGDDFDDNPFE